MLKTKCVGVKKIKITNISNKVANIMILSLSYSIGINIGFLRSMDALVEPIKTRIEKTQRTKTNILMIQLVIQGGLIFEVNPIRRSHDLRHLDDLGQPNGLGVIPPNEYWIVKSDNFNPISFRSNPPVSFNRRYS